MSVLVIMYLHLLSLYCQKQDTYLNVVFQDKLCKQEPER